MRKGYIINKSILSNLNNDDLNYYNSSIKDDSQDRKNWTNILIKNNTINMTDIQQLWFNQVQYDVFISHLHDDNEVAKKLAGYISKNTEKKVFIDSDIWGNIHELLKTIDDRYSRSDNDSNYYDYNKRNYSTSHVHALLSTALTNMIHKTNYFIFIDTSNNIKNLKENNKKTSSPWIYHELEISRIIDEAIKETTKYFSAESIKIEQSKESYKAEFDVDTKHLENIEALERLVNILSRQ